MCVCAKTVRVLFVASVKTWEENMIHSDHKISTERLPIWIMIWILLWFWMCNCFCGFVAKIAAPIALGVKKILKQGFVIPFFWDAMILPPPKTPPPARGEHFNCSTVVPVFVLEGFFFGTSRIPLFPNCVWDFLGKNSTENRHQKMYNFLCRVLILVFVP